MVNQWAVPADATGFIRTLAERIRAARLDALDNSVTNVAAVLKAPGGDVNGWLEVLEVPRIEIACLGEAGGNTTVNLWASNDKTNEVKVGSDLAITAGAYGRAEFDVIVRYVRVKVVSSAAGPFTGIKLWLNARSLG